jgi:hypothetical protein
MGTIITFIAVNCLIALAYYITRSGINANDILKNDMETFPLLSKVLLLRYGVKILVALNIVVVVLMVIWNNSFVGDDVTTQQLIEENENTFEVTLEWRDGVIENAEEVQEDAKARNAKTFEQTGKSFEEHKAESDAQVEQMLNK